MTEKLKIDGKEYPVRISYSVLRKLKADGIDLAKIEESDFEVYMPMLFYSLQSGASAEKVKLDLKIEDMENALDDCFVDFVKMIPLFFQKWTEGMPAAPVVSRATRRKNERDEASGKKK